MKTKKERLKAIRRIIRTRPVGNQEELKVLLENEGFSFNQATLSRDIKELKIVKYPDDNGSYAYTFSGGNNYTNEPNTKEENDRTSPVTASIEFSGNLAVLKTRPGYAMGIASDIDSLTSGEILGTIAGDDTILLIPREGVTRKEVVETLQAIIPRLKS